MTRSRGSSVGKTEWQRSARWSPSAAAAALTALAESGESVAAFASRHGVDAHRLYDWRRRLRSEGTPSAPSFVEIVRRPVATPAPCGFEVALANGAVVRVPASFDHAALRRLLTIVGSSC